MGTLMEPPLGGIIEPVEVIDFALTCFSDVMRHPQIPLSLRSKFRTPAGTFGAIDAVAVMLACRPG